MQYIITQLSTQPPRQITTRFGLSYAYKMRVQQTNGNPYPKPIEVLKKTPNLAETGFVVGGTLDGTISATQYECDNFKADPKPYNGSGGFKGMSNEQALRCNAMNNAVKYACEVKDLINAPGKPATTLQVLHLIKDAYDHIFNILNEPSKAPFEKPNTPPSAQPSEGASMLQTFDKNAPLDDDIPF